MRPLRVYSTSRLMYEYRTIPRVQLFNIRNEFRKLNTRFSPTCNYGFANDFKVTHCFSGFFFLPLRPSRFPKIFGFMCSAIGPAAVG